MLNDPVRTENSRLLALVAAYLTHTPAAISPGDVHALAEEFLLDPAEAFRLLLAARLGLDLDIPRDRSLYQSRLRPSVRLLNPAPFREDPYAALLASLRSGGGRITLEEGSLAAMELFPCGCMQKQPDGRVTQPLGFFESAFSYPSLRDGGREWMSLHPNEIATVLPHARAARGRVLCLGLGLGYYAYHASLSPQVQSVLIAERDPEILDLFTRLLLPRFPGRDKLRFYLGDAFDCLAASSPAEYDVVYADLWHDVADGLPLYRRLKAMERPGPRYQYWIGDTLERYLQGDV